MLDILIGLVIIAVAYLLGSIPFGLLLTKYAGLGDIRNIGSGNIGATNVLRTGNKKLAAATLAADVFKGIIAVMIAKAAGMQWVVAFAAMAAVMGHIFPVWLKFKGGKGVATALAVFWAVFWPLGLFACACWLAMFYVSRISSLSSLTAMILSPIVAGFFGGAGLFPMAIVIGGIVACRHKENIMRLLKGEEQSFSTSKADA